jgi:hypothetical protein
MRDIDAILESMSTRSRLPVAIAALSVACAAWAAGASAQEPTGQAPPAPAMTRIVLRPFPRLVPGLGEPTGDPNALDPFSAFTPARLSLVSDLIPVGPLLGNDCGEQSDASGNSFHGFPVQRYTFLQLTPHLVLHGFSNGGCALDSGIGGGVTYTVPLKKDMWLVASAGAYAIPGRGPTLPTRKRGDAGLDLVMRPAPDRTLSVGLGRRGVRFGGSF